MGKLVIKNKYGTIPQNLLNNEKITFKAKGLFGYLQSKPDGWRFSVQRIIYQSKDGKGSINSGLKELEKAGYLRRKATKNKLGKWNGYDYLLTEKPFADFPSTEKPSTENQSTISNIDNSNTDISNTDKRRKNFFVKKNKKKLKEKKYFQGFPMVEKNNKWYVIVNGDWLEFAGKDKDIEIRYE